MPTPTDNRPEDVALLAAVRAGDSAALGELMERFRRYLLRVADGELARLARPKVLPSDVVQDTFLEAYKLFERSQGDKAVEFRVWLRGILLNKTRDVTTRYVTTAKRDAVREAGDDELAGLRSDSPTPSADAVRRETAGLVRAALGRLDPDHRTVVVLRSCDGLEFAEIGSRMNRTEDAARMLFVRAIKRLDEELARDPAPPAG